MTDRRHISPATPEGPEQNLWNDQSLSASHANCDAELSITGPASEVDPIVTRTISRPTAPKTLGPDGPSEEVVFLGDGRFRRGGRPPIQLIDTEATVLETLVSYGASSIEDLRAATNCSSPHKVLQRIRHKYPDLADSIVVPGGKGRGGYRTTIRDASRG